MYKKLLLLYQTKSSQRFKEDLISQPQEQTLELQINLNHKHHKKKQGAADV